jgi:organic radical activating enzyme
MSINTIDDVIKTLNLLKEHESLNDFFDEDYEDDLNVNVINSNYIEEDSLKEEVDEIELSASHFFLDDDGLINKAAQAKLIKNNYKVIKLNTDYEPMTHCISCDEYMVLFTNY